MFRNLVFCPIETNPDKKLMARIKADTIYVLFPVSAKIRAIAWVRKTLTPASLVESKLIVESYLDKRGKYFKLPAKIEYSYP